MKKEIFLNSADETLRFGSKLASVLSEGGFVALYGDLGSGKSVIARGIAGSLGIEDISSPTFTILQRYETTPVLYHIDAYRLSGADELYDVGFEECLKPGILVVLEWADIVASALPKNRLDIYISGSGTESRKVEIICNDSLMDEEKFHNL